MLPLMYSHLLLIPHTFLNYKTSTLASNLYYHSPTISEYYFSPSNLSHDKYLRSRMNSEGFVCLAEISNWNRIKKIGASPLMVRTL